jgi:hypothetical protein
MRQNTLRTVVLAAAVALLAVAFAAGCAKKAEETVATTYTCPMHPDVKSDKPGECPQCGMDLVPTEEMGHGSGEMPAHGGM